jgi:uncharacterized protein (TIGR02001 family)
MKKLALLFLVPWAALAQPKLEAEVSGFSNFIWRGTTFSENKPAIQGVLELIGSQGTFLSTFVSNAEFSDDVMSSESQVTQETDFNVGQRWEMGQVGFQASYNRFYFPGAGFFDTDEFNLQLNWNGFNMELSYMDDFFGYQSIYKYVRLGYEWEYQPTLEGGLFIGYNAFDRPKGNLKTRCLDASCSEQAYTVNGAGNPDYWDIYQVSRKKFDNGLSLELAINITDRREYLADADGITLERAKDFTVLTGILFPFSL